MRRFERFGHRLVLNWRIFIDTQPIHQCRDAITLEDAHQIILGRYVKLRFTRIALTSTTTAQLIVDATRLMPLRTDHHQTAEFFDTLAELDVGTASGDVCCQRDRTFFTRSSDDIRFAFVVFGVQQLKFDALFFEICRDHFIFRDRTRADQHWSPFFVILFDRLSDRTQFTFFSLVDQIFFIFARNWLVWRYLDDIEAINLLEFLRLSKCRTGHTAQFFVHAKIILERNRRQRHTLLEHRHAFFRFNRLMQALIVPTPLHQTTSVLIHDDHFAIICYHIIFIAREQRLCTQRLIHMIDATNMIWGVQIFYAEHFLDFFDTFIRQGNLTAFFFERVVLGG